jgi:hypothetical protein
MQPQRYLKICTEVTVEEATTYYGRILFNFHLPAASSILQENFFLSHLDLLCIILELKKKINDLYCTSLTK